VSDDYFSLAVRR